MGAERRAYDWFYIFEIVFGPRRFDYGHSRYNACADDAQGVLDNGAYAISYL